VVEKAGPAASDVWGSGDRDSTLLCMPKGYHVSKGFNCLVRCSRKSLESLLVKSTTDKSVEPPKNVKSKRAAVSAPAPADEARDYVGPTAVPKTSAPSAEPEAKVVLNLPDAGAQKADEEQVKKARARRRSATVRVARADIPELMKLRQGAPAPDSSPSIEDAPSGDDVDVDLREGGISKPASLQPPPAGPAMGRSRSSRPGARTSRTSRPPARSVSSPPPSAVLSRPPAAARGARGRKVTLAILVAVAVAGAVGLFMILDPKFNPETQKTVESAVENAAAAQTAESTPSPPPDVEPTVAQPTATASAPTAGADTATPTLGAPTPPPPGRPPPTWQRPAAPQPPPPRPAPPPPRRPPPSDIPRGI